MTSIATLDPITAEIIVSGLLYASEEMGIAVRNGIGLRIPHPEGFDHPNLLIVLGAATLGATRLIDNVDVIRKDGED